MKLIVNDLNISELVERITWSGDTRQVARKLEFTIASKATDYYLPKVKIAEGDKVLFLDEKEAVIFGGVVFEISKSAAADTTGFMAFDLLFYVNQSDINRIFDATPEVITSQICKELGIPFGGAAKTGIKVYMPCLNKKGYAAIMMAYTYASRKNGKKYIPIIKETNKLYVIEKGTFSGVTLEGYTKITDASYKVTLQNMANKVLVTDKSGKIVDTIVDSTSMYKYGTVQRVYSKEDGKDAKMEARAILKGVERESSCNSISDIRGISGYSILMQEPITGLYGKFFIESDTHTFENGSATMQLTLAFENLMDEMEIEKEEKKAEKKEKKES